ncbi:MAG: restriction endonuclease subunit S [Syntrophomonadaceae bacterium]|nr:restriction endonuclease subunit S [Syntrophomonadaceae bacterium]
MLPSGWTDMKLGNFVALQRGYDLISQDRIVGNIPVIGCGGINGYHSEANAKSPGVALGRSGAGYGTAFYCPVDFWAHNTVLFVTDFKGNHPKFVYYFLDALDFSNYNSGGAQPSLNRNYIYPIDVVIPPIQEQIAIANLLSTWDRCIEKSERIILSNERKYFWLIHNLINNSCGDWEHLPIHEMFNTVSEKKNGNEELLSVTQEHGVIPRTMLMGRVMSPAGSTDAYKLIRKGDFAVSLRSFQGGIEYSQYQGIISPAYTVLRTKIKIHNAFYKYFFKSAIFIQKYLSIAVIGIRDGRQISIPDLMCVKLPYPPMDEQKRIAKTLNTACQEIDLLKKQAEAYRRQKRGLMQKLLTGQWRVKVDEKVEHGE